MRLTYVNNAPFRAHRNVFLLFLFYILCSLNTWAAPPLVKETRGKVSDRGTYDLLISPGKVRRLAINGEIISERSARQSFHGLVNRDLVLAVIDIDYGNGVKFSNTFSIYKGRHKIINLTFESVKAQTIKAVPTLVKDIQGEFSDRGTYDLLISPGKVRRLTLNDEIISERSARQYYHGRVNRDSGFARIEIDYGNGVKFSDTFSIYKGRHKIIDLTFESVKAQPIKIVNDRATVKMTIFPELPFEIYVDGKYWASNRDVYGPITKIMNLTTPRLEKKATYTYMIRIVYQRPNRTSLEIRKSIYVYAGVTTAVDLTTHSEDSFQAPIPSRVHH